MWFRQVFCALREHTSVSYAKIATVGGFCNVDLIIVKATAPNDLPLPEKYIHELLKIFSISPLSFRSFSLSFTRRFGRTHCWKVAIKCLLLLHRLLRSLPEYSPFRAELLWTRSNGLLSLYPCHFRDDSSSNPEDYTMFIRSYAQLLDEALDCVSLESKATEEEEEEMLLQSLQQKMNELGRKLELLPQLQSVIDRVIDCRPTGVAARSLIVQSAMKHIIRDSFICYTTFRTEIVLVLDNLFQMSYKSCALAFGIYKKAALQASQLCEFYDWCKAKGFCGSYEYPFIERIPQIQIQALETFLDGMWQITDQSSSSTASPSWRVESKSSLTDDDDDDKQVVRRKNVVIGQWENFEKSGFARELEGKEEMKPLIQFDDDDEDGENDNWEALLDASVNIYSLIPRHNFLTYPNAISNGYGNEVYGKEKTQWQLQVYNPNPFLQPCYLPNCNVSLASNPQNHGDFKVD